MSAGAGASTSRVGTLERRYLSGTFAELCRIESPSGRERECAQRVIAELRALDVTVEEDGAGALVGSDCGNLLARVPAGGQASFDESVGSERRSILLCAHLDTVPLQAPVEPVLVDGGWENANDGILGADNKAAVAVMLALARHVRQQGAPVDVELLFTVGEEIALAGARVFDTTQLRSAFGYVFDHASPIGEVVMHSPTHFRLEARFRGAAAHAGIRPEEGHSAILAAAHAIASMRHGRIDEMSTVNVGTIAGGTAMNVVPEHCALLAEVRGPDDARAEDLVAEIVDRVHEAANLPECSCDVDVSVERTFSGFSLSERDPAVTVARAALRSCGHE
ncbi:MAG TPA: M20/M25/M40 family metallo-hydrolase, partial [Solirubrobacteraceae bacterium]|nr:M20/M25/M40 family metallo-hydrolase [Solirubrobacteraceae bacterium]